MKKRVLQVIGIVFLAVLMVGCTNKNQGKDQDSTAKTKIVKTENGDLEIPKNPKKVIVNWYIHDVVSLGVTPVAYQGWAQETMPFFKEIEKVPMIKKWEKEELLSYEPDLIITYDQEDYNKFSKIAPVIVISEKLKAEERLTLLGAILNKEDKAKELVSNFEKKLTAAKGTFEKDEYKGKSFSIFEDWGSGSYGVYYETGSRGGTLLYDYLGLKYPDKLADLIKTSGEKREGLSYEVAADYFGDYVLWFLQPDKESEYEKTKMWETIPAVKDGNILKVDGKYAGLFYYSDVASMTGQLDYFVENFDQLIKK